MYLITNRKFYDDTTINAFGKNPNPEGPNELLMANVSKPDGDWKVERIDNCLPVAEVIALKDKFKLDIDEKEPWHGSLKITCELFEKARQEKKSILFFIHGYNNDVDDVLKAAHEIEELHNVIVVPFTWPANGGGILSGTASYLSDKADARVSTGALNRVVGKIHEFHLMMVESLRKTHLAEAEARHPDNPIAASQLFTKLVERDCQVKINLLCHSMGNYLLKHTLATGSNATSKLVFDNVCLVAADTNNEKHADWVGKLDVRNRVYVVINENDSALKASRIKPGEEQKARLGHYIKQLNSANANYIDVTDAEHIGSEHTYFKGDVMQDNPNLKALFTDMFNGKAVENHLVYHADTNSYKFPN